MCAKCSSNTPKGTCKTNRVNPATKQGTLACIKAGYSICPKNLWIKGITESTNVR